VGAGPLSIRTPLPYTVCLIGGMAFGFLFGDSLFPQLEATFGELVTDLFLGTVGALLAAIAYEIVTMWLRSD
jgi:hypothetical protein